MKIKLLHLSYYIINKFSYVPDNGISPLKTQKLLYYVYVWGIVNDKKFFNKKFFKWSFGPVLPEVYQEFKSFGDNPIQIKGDFQTILNNNEQIFADFVVSNYESTPKSPKRTKVHLGKFVFSPYSHR